MPSSSIFKPSIVIGDGDGKENTQSSLTSMPLLEKANPTLLLEQHHIISCIYVAEVNNGGIPAAKQTSVVNLRSNNTLADISNTSISLSPLAIQCALAPSKASLLIESGCLKCLNCDNEASHVCSSVAVSRGVNNSCNASEKSQVLLVSERLICSCGNDECASEARRRRNQTALKNGEHGCGFNFSFRCALKPISRVLDSLPIIKEHPRISNEEL
jgi:hypothetical protein